MSDQGKIPAIAPALEQQGDEDQDNNDVEWDITVTGILPDLDTEKSLSEVTRALGLHQLGTDPELSSVVSKTAHHLTKSVTESVVESQVAHLREDVDYLRDSSAKLFSSLEQVTDTIDRIEKMVASKHETLLKSLDVLKTSIKKDKETVTAYTKEVKSLKKDVAAAVTDMNRVSGEAYIRRTVDTAIKSLSATELAGTTTKLELQDTKIQRPSSTSLEIKTSGSDSGFRRHYRKG